MTKACSTDAYKMTFTGHYHTSKTKYMCNIKMERGTVELILIMYWPIKDCQLYLATKLHMLHSKEIKLSIRQTNVDTWVNPVNQTF
jgi:hypothetical protein